MRQNKDKWKDLLISFPLSNFCYISFNRRRLKNVARLVSSARRYTAIFKSYRNNKLLSNYSNVIDVVTQLQWMLYLDVMFFEES